MENIKIKCIYLHIKQNGEVFYVGIGNYNRPKIKTSRNVLWRNIVKKNPEYEISVLKNNLSIKEAIELAKNSILHKKPALVYDLTNMRALLDSFEEKEQFLKSSKWYLETGF